MFKNLSDQLSKISERLKTQSRLSEKNIADTLQEIEHNLLDADVHVHTARSMIEKIKQECIGQKASQALNPGQTFVKIFHQALVDILSHPDVSLNLRKQPPVVVLLAGLQGAGKTTTAGKLALHISKKLKKRTLLASCDVYRPAALEQLKVISTKINCDYFEHQLTDAVEAATQSLAAAKSGLYEVLIVDTAGRNTLEDAMMKEISNIQNHLQPQETLFVADSLLGQQAAHIAKTFGEYITFTGVILTKIDGDSRGGAALSIQNVTGQPIKFVGSGEKIENLEPFNPAQVASVILGMGDLLSLINKFKDPGYENKKQQLIQNQFSLNDFKKELLKIEKSGGMSGLIKYLPKHLQQDPRLQKTTHFQKYIYIIDSMTKKERTDPTLIKASQKIRISKGSGTSIPLINQLLMQFKQIKKIYKKNKNKKQLTQMLGF